MLSNQHSLKANSIDCIAKCHYNRLKFSKVLYFGTKARKCRNSFKTSAKGQDKDRIDWDQAWKRYQSSITEEPQKVVTEIPRNKYVDPRRERIKEQEMLALNIWSRESFFGIAGFSVLAILLCFILISNVPTDSRCTLFWC
eukprot:TRINITY_DN34624_c0_g1_i1.p2 TRINITY_DN34624_c0_g1~~TRINITY_DN34624_c0_g1_i1.p2  ORF type:complete len:150 (-),score=1.30 TRINITY_DN34624_c0_g1_i1:163-585(-)